MTLAILAIVIAAFGGLAAFTAFGVRRIEREHPPAGRMIEVEGGRLHVLELGPVDAPPVVLLHGASGNLGDMRMALGDRLSARYRVILIDRPGHGWSDRPGGSADASPARQARLIHHALSRIGVGRAILVGHSWSGALAAAYALDHPASVAGLVLLAPVTHPWPTGVAWYHRILAFPIIGPFFACTLALPLGQWMIGPGVRSVFAPQHPPADYVARAGGEMILRPSELIANAEDIVQLKSFVMAQAPKYAAIKSRTVIITGDIDAIVSPDIHSRAIAAMLPRGTLIVLSGAGHMVEFTAADRVVAAIDDIASGNP